MPHSLAKPEKPTIGRPVDQGKTDLILQTARHAFFTEGFSQASIEAIAAAAGVSKVTIYNRFGTKEALFTAVVTRECDTMREGLAHAVNASGDIRAQLTGFAENMARFLDREDITRMETHLAVEAQHNPELGKIFLDAGPRRLHQALAELLAAAAARGELVMDDPWQAAELFASMIKGLADMDRRFCQGHADNHARTQKRITSAVDLFLNGYGQG